MAVAVAVAVPKAGLLALPRLLAPLTYKGMLHTASADNTRATPGSGTFPAHAPAVP